MLRVKSGERYRTAEVVERNEKQIKISSYFFFFFHNFFTRNNIRYDMGMERRHDESELVVVCRGGK